MHCSKQHLHSINSSARARSGRAQLMPRPDLGTRISTRAHLNTQNGISRQKHGAMKPIL
jgi:hypothetical protein